MCVTVCFFFGIRRIKERIKEIVARYMYILYRYVYIKKTLNDFGKFKSAFEASLLGMKKQLFKDIMLS